MLLLLSDEIENARERTFVKSLLLSPHTLSTASASLNHTLSIYFPFPLGPRDCLCDDLLRKKSLSLSLSYGEKKLDHSHARNVQSKNQYEKVSRKNTCMQFETYIFDGPVVYDLSESEIEA